MDCPDPALWVAWSEGRLAGAEGRRLKPHLTVCPSCRRELAALAEASGASGRRVLPARFSWAAAAVLLLSLGFLLRPGRREEAAAPEVRVFHAAAVPSAARLSPGPLEAGEWLVGATGEVSLGRDAAGELVREHGLPTLRLARGTAWVETSGDPVRVRLEGWEGAAEISDGALAVWEESSDSCSWPPEALAAGSRWRMAVSRGTVQVRGPALPGGEPPADPRGWRAPPGIDGLVRDSVRALGSPPGGAWVAECLVRKRAPSAEAALRFRTGGKGWELPLGIHLPSSSWVRLRVEMSPASVRVLSGGRECLDAEAARLREVACPLSEAGGLALRAWGGDVEVAGFRLRESSP